VVGCGEQCITLLCRFYGVDVREDRILELLAPSVSGECSFTDISRCIKSIGLDCYAFRGDIKDLSNIRQPVILLFKRTKDDKVGHFLVSMLDPKTKTLIGYDPAMSGVPFELTPEKLETFWTRRGMIIFPPHANSQLGLHFLLVAVASILLGVCLAQIRVLKQQKDI